MKSSQSNSPTFVGRTVTVLTLTVTAFVIVSFVWYASQVLLVVFLGVLLGIVLRKAGVWGSGWIGLSTRVLVVLVFFLGLLLLLGLLTLLGADLVNQFGELSQQIPQALNDIEKWVRSSDTGSKLLDRATRIDTWTSKENGLFSRAQTVAFTTFGILSGTVLIAVLSLFLAYRPEVYLNGLLTLFPPSRRKRVETVLHEVGSVLARWFVGKLVSMAVVGILVGVGLAILGVGPVLALAGLAAILAFVPYVGPILSAAPAVLIAAAEDPMQGLYVILLFGLVQGIEGNLITPIIERKSVSLPPAFTIFLQLIFGLLFGFLGLFVASPVGAAAVILVRRFYVEDYLEAGEA